VIWDNYRASNGTGHELFRYQTCDRCVKDHKWHLPDADGDSCPIIMDALIGEHAYPNELGPPQWHHDTDTGRSWCDEFEGPCDCD
jgi:hypothetical protein